MKILHTGDLHLGKVFHEISLLEDQKQMLNQLLAELDRDDYRALLIAGDVYDRSIPPAEAVGAFSSFLTGLRNRFPALAVFLIPGNHDSAARLSFASEILRKQNVYITCDPEDAFTPVILSQKNETVAFFSLPFLHPGSLIRSRRQESAPDGTLSLFPEDSGTDGGTLFSQADLAAEAAERFQEVLRRADLKNVPAVLTAHLFTAGGRESASERIFLGTAEKVPPELFRPFSYVALGHLHRFQKAAERIYYAGSPLAYAFDEAGEGKFFLKVEIGPAEDAFPVQVTPVPVHPPHNVTRLRAAFADLLAGKYAGYAEDYLEIELTDPGVRESPMQQLRGQFPFLLSVKQNIPKEGTGHTGRNGEPEERKPLDNFTDFERFLYPEQPPEELEKKTALFSAALEECTQQTGQAE